MDESLGRWGKHSVRMTAEMWDAVGRTIRDSEGNGRIRNDDPKLVEGKFSVGCRAHQHECLKPVRKTHHSSRSELPGNKDKQLGVRETTASG